MKIFRKSIVAKLWVSMVILALIITWVIVLVQSNIIKGIYYKQQFEHISQQAYDIANSINLGNDFIEKMSLISTLTNTNIMLIDREGLIEECHGMGMNISAKADTSQKVSIINYHGGLLSQEDLNKILSGKSVSYSGMSHVINTETLSVAVPVRIKGEITGALIVSHSMAAFQGNLYDFQKVILNVGIGGLILATFLSLLFSRFLSKPLIKMNEVALAMSEGDFSRKVDVKSNDEIGILSNSLNVLSYELQEKIVALERLDQTRKDFVTGVSHELRTPLTIIQGYAEALQDNMANSEDERRELIDGIVDESGRLKRLVSDLLDLRKIEMGQEIIELKDIDASLVIIKSVDKMRTIANSKNINFYLDVEPSLPVHQTNPDRLEQVMLNLLENALRFTPTGGNVHIKSVRLNGFVRISVTDNGSGIPLEEQDLVWEKFYKVDKSRVRKDGGGTGLGLSIVRRLVERMGGGVGLQSFPGMGTTFYFTLVLDE